MAGKLGDILIAKGFIGEKELVDALQSSESSKGRLGVRLIKKGLITPAQLGEALAEQFEVAYQDVVPEQVHAQIVRLLPESFARERLVAPVGVGGSQMTLAMAAPDDIETISEVELITGYSVEPVVAMEEGIRGVLERGFDERISARQTVVDIKITEMEEQRKKSGVVVKAESDDPDAPVVRLVRSILMGAVNAGASDIHLEPFLPQMRVRYRVDGELETVMTIPKHTEEAVVGRIKVMADMDTTENRKPQDGNLTIQESGMRASYRVSTIPVVGGEKVVMRVIDEGNKVFTFDALGMQPRDVELVKTLLDKPHGMIIMTGPTGSGKTTTMYTMLTNIDSSTTNISTVEDPVEFKLPGINQVYANAEHGMGFANALKYLMRQDPDVIMVGEIRDHETAVTSVQAALTGHLLISTLHTNDAVGSVTRLNDLGVDYFKIAAALLGTIAQRLLRRICQHCKEPAVPNEKMLASLLQHRELPPGATFYRGRGCPKCMGSGYAGRLPIYEIFVLTPEVEKAIEAGMPHSKIKEVAIQGGMVELAVAGLEAAMAGKTSIEEVYFKLSG